MSIQNYIAHEIFELPNHCTQPLLPTSQPPRTQQYPRIVGQCNSICAKDYETQVGYRQSQLEPMNYLKQVIHPARWCSVDLYRRPTDTGYKILEFGLILTANNLAAEDT